MGPIQRYVKSPRSESSRAGAPLLVDRKADGAGRGNCCRWGRSLPNSFLSRGKLPSKHPRGSLRRGEGTYDKAPRSTKGLCCFRGPRGCESMPTTWFSGTRGNWGAWASQSEALPPSIRQ
jgi:hypothetical protein